ncbi:MAG TPA: GyrI-like domain-containing protein [Terracidiphilus sp.]|jgi:predicted transcriptional regulator YdeE|nr:GyrI-like domain-containing protein [Terracidiphilus sp.]
MNLTEIPETMTWPATHYVFVEKVGPFMTNAGAAWNAAHSLVPALSERNEVVGYTSLYKMGPQIYRAGFALDAAPVDLPAGLSYELFPGGKYARFLLTGPYADLPQASGRVWEIAKGSLELRDDFAIENYLNDPRVTPEGQLKTEILVPLA